MRPRIRRQTAAVVASCASLGLVAGFTVPSGAVTSRGGVRTAATSCAPVTTYSQPPAGFDPLTATNAQLEEYGFPLPPPGEDAGATAAWQAMVSGATQYVAPDPTCGTTSH